MNGIRKAFETNRNYDSYWFCIPIGFQEEFLKDLHEMDVRMPDGSKITPERCSGLVAIDPDRTLRYVSTICWRMAVQKKGRSSDSYSKILLDYGKLKNGEDAVFAIYKKKTQI